MIWDPHHENDIKELEKVQKRAARFVTSNYTFEHGSTKENMNSLNWKPLEERRATAKLKMLFKAKHGTVDIPFDHLKNHSKNLRHSCRRPENFAIPASSVDSHLYSFYPNTIRLWNSLPEEAKKMSSVDTFKSFVENVTIRATYQNNIAKSS